MFGPIARVLRLTLLSQALGIALFLLSGWALTRAQASDDRGVAQTFFDYRIEHLDGTPFWYLGCLGIMLFNGIYTLKVSVLEGTVTSRPGDAAHEWGAALPLTPVKIVTMNFVLVPILIGSFMVVRVIHA